jgi:DNA-binding NarL/FixJ family response regulator
VAVISVLIVHPQALQRLGLRMLLTARPGLTVVGETAAEAEAIALADRFRPDVVLMAGGELGTGGTQTVRRLSGSSRVLLLSPAGNDTWTCAALKAGAGGVVLPDVTPDELVAAVRTVAAGDAVVSPGVTRRLIDAVRRQRPASAPAARTGEPIGLTRRERDVLTAVASGCSNAEIAERLSIAPTTVKSHVSHILTKIGARGRVQAVSFAYEAGLVHAS